MKVKEWKKRRSNRREKKNEQQQYCIKHALDTSAINTLGGGGGGGDSRSTDVTVTTTAAWIETEPTIISFLCRHFFVYVSFLFLLFRQMSTTIFYSTSWSFIKPLLQLSSKTQILKKRSPFIFIHINLCSIVVVVLLRSTIIAFLYFFFLLSFLWVCVSLCPFLISESAVFFFSSFFESIKQSNMLSLTKVNCFCCSSKLQKTDHSH